MQQFYWAGNNSQIISASPHPVIDDDSIGGITIDENSSNWCMEATCTRGGDLNLEVCVGCGAERPSASIAVALINRSPMAAMIAAPWDTLGLGLGDNMTVRDIWAAADKGVHTAKYETEVGGKTVALLVLTPAAI